jgi:hypothetical protein
MRVELRFFVATMITFLALAFEASAWAQQERPVVVGYEAPPECASAEAFQVLLAIEIARSPNPDRPWRFSVVIRRQADSYAGTLTTESGVRTVTATRCDDVTAALALIVAMAEPATEAPPPPPSAPPVPLEVAPAPRAVDSWRAGVVPDRSVERPQLEWRVGARALASNHGIDSAMLGGLGFFSVELPWGFRKMLFEVGTGAFSGPQLTYLFVDTQACLVDLPIAQTGLSALGCLRVAGASFKSSLDGFTSDGGALWVGGGVRLRWQAQFGLFLEGNVDAVYGTVSSGETTTPGWFDGGASVGYRF